jgi:hypothetical protein
MSTALLDVLRAANAEVLSFLRLNSCKTRDYSILNLRIQVLAEKLQQVTCQIPPSVTSCQFDAETQGEIDRYVKNIEELKISLQALHERALEKRNQLADERAHSRAARSWLSSMKDST